ncbi:MAG: hypothetical protein K6G03_00025 [Lachnospiraceae bacterium]|nr:hypothetical protein [Lachnospiraceae bacterium]
MNKADLSGIISSPKKPNIMQFVFTLTEEIDRDIMFEAMQKTIKRYPYFSFRIIKTEKGYDKTENPLPIVVKSSFSDEIILGSEDVNYHWVAAACQEKQFKLAMSHIIADGRSAMRFYKTLLYCYICEKHHVQLNPEGITMPDSQISPDEDVKIDHLVDDEDSAMLTTCEDPFVIPDTVEDDMKGYRYHIAVPERDFLALSKSNDNSPLTLLTVYMAKMFQRMYPESKKHIYAGIAADVRKALNCPESRFTNSYMVFIHHDPAKLDQDIERLGTMTRGQIIIQSDEGILRYIHNSIMRILAKVRSTPDQAEKQRLMKELYRIAQSNPTYGISYVGNPEWGSLEPYIEEEYSLVMSRKLFIEVNVAGGNFCISWVQGFKNDAYIKTFQSLLKESGINCAVSGPYIQEWPKCCIP